MLNLPEGVGVKNLENGEALVVEAIAPQTSHELTRAQWVARSSAFGHSGFTLGSHSVHTRFTLGSHWGSPTLGSGSVHAQHTQPTKHAR